MGVDSRFPVCWHDSLTEYDMECVSLVSLLSSIVPSRPHPRPFHSSLSMDDVIELEGAKEMVTPERGGEESAEEFVDHGDVAMDGENIRCCC